MTDRRDANLARSEKSLEIAKTVGEAANLTGNFESGLDILYGQNAITFDVFRAKANIPRGEMRFRQDETTLAKTDLKTFGKYNVICTIDLEVMDKYHYDRTGEHYTISKTRGNERMQIQSTNEIQTGRDGFADFARGAGRTGSGRNDRGVWVIPGNR